MPAPPTLVLDTNAWLDLLVFGDPALQGLPDAVARGHARIAVDDRAMAELERVLAYPALAIAAGARAAHLSTARALSELVQPTTQALPRCRDADDQMFLEIAVGAGAAWLLTRDDALLRMARRIARDHGVAIATPAAWRDAVSAQISKR